MSGYISKTISCPNLPNEILSYWINQKNATVCKLWNLIQCQKPTSITLSHYGFGDDFFCFLQKRNLTRLDISQGAYVNFSMPSISMLKTLIIDQNDIIADQNLQHLKNVISLSLEHNASISSIKHLVNATELNLKCNSGIRDSEIENLTNITKLNIRYNNLITDCSLMYLTKINHLSLCDNNFITNKSILYLTNLTFLDIFYCGGRCHKLITDKSIKKLTNLRVLRLGNTYSITYRSLKYLTQLVELTLSENLVNSNDLINFTNLESLVAHGSNITGYSVEKLTGLQSLSLHWNNNITNENIYKLTNLTNISLTYCHHLDIDKIKSNLPKLIKSVAYGCSRY